MKGLGEHMPNEKRRFIHSLIIPLVFLLFCWLAKIWELVTGMSLHEFGIYPREFKGLAGILFTPFIHGDLDHISANSLSFLLLGVGLFYFYREIALKVFLYIFFLSDILLWLGGRASWHIGASGLIYGIGAFLIVSGIIRRHISLVALSFVIIFAYGSMFWHIFPLKVNDPISWEGHLMGVVSGILLAFIYRHKGPKKQEWIWKEDESDEDEYTTDIENEDIETELKDDEFK